jgi:alpha-mannosidase
MWLCRVCACACVCVCRCYPHDELRALWREVLLYQFHDILPGSSIKRVYDECELRYAEMQKKVARMTARSRARVVELVAVAVKPLATAVVPAPAAATDGAVAPMLLWNVLSWKRNEWVRCPPSGGHGPSSPVAPVWVRASVPALGATAPASPAETAAAIDVAQATLRANGASSIENECLRVTFDASDGSVLSILDKQHRREALDRSAGAANRLAVYLDDGDGALTVA